MWKGPRRKPRSATHRGPHDFSSAYFPSSPPALTGKKVDRIWDAVDKTYAGFSQTISTNKLNSWLSSIRETGHTVSQGKAVLRMKYVTQTGTCRRISRCL